MPVYDTAPVVFEIGYEYTKVGFAADPYPRYIVPSQLREPTTGKIRNIFADEMADADRFYEDMLDFVQNLFFKHVFVHPRERTVVIVESVFCSTRVRETLARVLFQQFEAFSVLLVPAHLAALATLAIDTAVVIDCGFRECSVLPIYAGVQVLNAWQAQPIAGQAVHAELRRQLIEIGGVEAALLSDQVVEDIKVRTCFVTTAERAAAFAADSTEVRPCPDVEYPVGGGQVITIPGRVRETAYEVMFAHDNERSSLPYMVLDAVLACPVDMRRQMADNLFLVGGTAMAIGVAVRLQQELRALLRGPLYKDRLFVEDFKFHTAPAKANIAMWLGASMYGATELAQTRAITRDAYGKAGQLPDWVQVELEPTVAAAATTVGGRARGQ